jgi:ZIP family zinc transporter
MLGFAAGVMLAAAYWSLLEPSIELARLQDYLPWVPATVGLLAGVLFLAMADHVLPHLHPSLERARAEGPRTQWPTTTLLILAITLHNIPEGLAIGVAFGAAAAPAQGGLADSSAFGAAVALAIGIALQNVGLCSIPYVGEGCHCCLRQGRPMQPEYENITTTMRFS